MSDLNRLASLVKSRNTVENNIATLIGQPVNLQSVGEYIASVIFSIELNKPRTNKGSDGRFIQGPLAGHTVDVQWRTKHDGLMNIKQDFFPDYYLLFTGPKESASSHSIINPWVIESVFLFNSSELLAALHERGVQLGSGTSITGPLWERAEIYPIQRDNRLILSSEQQQLLALFR